MPMRRALCMLLVAGCRNVPSSPVPLAPPPPGAAPAAELELLFWSTVAEGAAGPLVQIRQIATGKSACHVEVTAGGEQRWSLDKCIATRRDLRFLSADGESVLVLELAPEFTTGDSMDGATLGRLWRHGEAPADLTPRALRLPAGVVRINAGRLRWLGDRDQKIVAQGVEVQLADGSLRVLRFDGVDVPRPAAPAAAPAPVTTAREPACNPCSYTDDQGTYHMVDSADEIPAKFRKRAARVRAVENRADAAPPPSPAAAAEGAPAQPVRDEFVEQWAANQKAAREAVKPPPERTHYQRVMDMLVPGYRYEPQTDGKVPCKDPDGKEAPCKE